MTGFPLGWVPRGPQILRILIAAAVSWQVCEMGAGVRNWKVNDPHALSVVLRRPVRRMGPPCGNAYSPGRGWDSRASGAWHVWISQRLRLPRCPPPAEGRQVIWPQAPRSVYFDLAEIQPRCQPSLSVHHEAR